MVYCPPLTEIARVVFPFFSFTKNFYCQNHLFKMLAASDKKK